MSRQRRLRYSTLWNPAPTRAQALQILELEEGVPESVIKSAYRRLASASHPDRGGDPEVFKAATAARDVLLKRSVVPSAAPTAGTSVAEERRAWGGGAYAPGVLWQRLIPGLNMRAATAFIGLRADGRVDLYLKDTYQATFTAPHAALFVIYRYLQSLPDVRERDAEEHFCILARETPGTSRIFSLPALAAGIGFRYVKDQPPNAPSENDEETVTERDFE
jgi:hypothetical protein